MIFFVRLIKNEGNFNFLDVFIDGSILFVALGLIGSVNIDYYFNSSIMVKHKLFQGLVLFFAPLFLSSFILGVTIAVSLFGYTTNLTHWTIAIFSASFAYAGLFKHFILKNS